MNLVHRPRPPSQFYTAKSSRPIPVRGPLSEDLLIQASLDPRVIAIRFIDTLTFCGREVRIAAPAVQRDEGECVLLLTEDNPDRDPDEQRVEQAVLAHSAAVERVSAEHVLREPLATTSRVVWRQRFVQVDLAMRLALSSVLDEESSMTLDELCRRVPGPRDPVFAVMALACEGLLRIDLSEGFDRHTRVWGPR